MMGEVLHCHRNSGQDHGELELGTGKWDLWEMGRSISTCYCPQDLKNCVESAALKHLAHPPPIFPYQSGSSAPIFTYSFKERKRCFWKKSITQTCYHQRCLLNKRVPTWWELWEAVSRVWWMHDCPHRPVHDIPHKLFWCVSWFSAMLLVCTFLCRLFLLKDMLLLLKMSVIVMAAYFQLRWDVR